MPAISISKTYADGDILFESDLDTIREDIETFLNVTKINDDNIQDSGITASSKLVDASITAAKMGADSVTTAKILDNNVTDAKLRQSAALSVIGRSANSTGNVADIAAANDGEVLRRSGTSIGFGTIATAGIADGAVTQVKRASLGQQISSGCGTFTTTSTSAVDVTNLSVTITTVGRPVFLTLINDYGSSSTQGLLGAADTGDTQATAYFDIVRDSTAVATFPVNVTGASANILSQVPCSSITHIDLPAAGTYTYKVQARVISGDVAQVSHAKLVAFEL